MMLQQPQSERSEEPDHSETGVLLAGSSLRELPLKKTQRMSSHPHTQHCPLPHPHGQRRSRQSADLGYPWTEMVEKMVQGHPCLAQHGQDETVDSIENQEPAHVEQ